MSFLGVCVLQEILMSMGITAMGDVINILKHAKKANTMVRDQDVDFVCVMRTCSLRIQRERRHSLLQQRLLLINAHHLLLPTPQPLVRHLQCPQLVLPPRKR
jgi:hypothetical protein